MLNANAGGDSEVCLVTLAEGVEHIIIKFKNHPTQDINVALITLGVGVGVESITLCSASYH